MKRIAIVVFALLALCLPLAAQRTAFGTGDKSFDASLEVMNETAKGNLEGFKAQLSADFGQSAAVVEDLFSVDKLEPADAYMALEVAKASGKPVETVVAEHGKAKAWGKAAKNLGIKPGSAEFKALKGKAEKYAQKVKGPQGKGKPKAKGKAAAGSGS